MLAPTRLGLTTVLGTALCAAQGHPVGFADIAIANPTAFGTPILTATVRYPAAVAGPGVPILPRTAGWPCVIFLHGIFSTGGNYVDIGDDLASAGFVVLLPNTAISDSVTQEHDARGLFLALDELSRTEPVFAGALDIGRVGLGGHSMGGGNVGNVLAGNPGFRCGFAFSPQAPRGTNAALVDVPVAIVVGQADVYTPPATTARPFYDGIGTIAGMKSYTLLDHDCNHLNVVGLAGRTGTSGAVFARTSAQAVGFFRRWLLGAAAGLETVVGSTAQADPRLVTLDVVVEDPDAWSAETLQIGQTTRVSVVAEPGPAGLLAALGPGFQQTPVGALLIDPVTMFLAMAGPTATNRRLDADVSVPADPSYRGVTLAVQAFGLGTNGGLQLGAATTLQVAR